MSGELRIVRTAIPASLGLAGAGALILLPLRGPDAAVSVLLAGGLVVGNAVLAAAISALGGLLTPTGPALMALPSFAFRMGAMLTALTALKGVSSLDEPVFAIAFVVVLSAMLASEARAFKRTPWLALTFGPKEHS